jgi:hypothetical protein
MTTLLCLSSLAAWLAFNGVLILAVRRRIEDAK